MRKHSTGYASAFSRSALPFVEIDGRISKPSNFKSALQIVDNIRFLTFNRECENIQKDMLQLFHSLHSEASNLTVTSPFLPFSCHLDTHGDILAGPYFSAAKTFCFSPRNRSDTPFPRLSEMQSRSPLANQSGAPFALQLLREGHAPRQRGWQVALRGQRQLDGLEQVLARVARPWRPGHMGGASPPGVMIAMLDKSCGIFWCSE